MEQSLDCFDDLSKEELEAVAYLDSVAPFRETIVCLKASLLRKIGRGGSSQLLFDITVQETTFNVVATSLDGSSLDLSLQKRSGRSIFPNYAHFLITDYGMLRVPNDGINVTPPEQPLQPYEVPGQKGVAPLPNNESLKLKAIVNVGSIIFVSSGCRKNGNPKLIPQNLIKKENNKSKVIR